MLSQTTTKLPESSIATAGFGLNLGGERVHLELTPDRGAGCVVTLAEDPRKVGILLTLARPDDDEVARRVGLDGRELLVGGRVAVDPELRPEQLARNRTGTGGDEQECSGATERMPTSQDSHGEAPA